MISLPYHKFCDSQAYSGLDCVQYDAENEGEADRGRISF